MSNWHAKVHKSGSKVAVFNGSKLVKVVDASSETYEPAEAQKFAEELVNELSDRSAAQMTDTQAPISVATESELQSSSLAAVNQQATGKAPRHEHGDSVAPVAEEIEEKADAATEADEDEEKEVTASENKNLRQIVANLKKKLASEREERFTERKARRGLAIAKQMVVDGNLEDSYDAIKAKVAAIVKLEDAEIDRLEKKMAGETEFDSVDDAMKEYRRQARIARINRQAAAEAQEDGDEHQADALDKKADEAEAKMSHAASIAEDMKKSAEAETKAEEVKEEKKEAAAPAEVKEEAKEPVAEEVKEEKADAEEKCEEPSKTATLARKYRSIAANHRKLAEEAEAKGDIAHADKQDELADAAEEKAEEIEKSMTSENPATNRESEVKAEEKVAEAEETKEEAKEDDKDEDEKEEAKESSKEPGNVVTSSKHSLLQREGEAVTDDFGIDKNASLVEQNDYSSDPEVELLSKMWRGSGADDQ